ncbi:MAG: hypothetical protein DDT27_01539 [Dehalococcoidia bacterium]|nr:hypothetical protein [Chloroflexota bacterium]
MLIFFYLTPVILFILLIVGATLLLAARGKRPAARIAAMALGIIGGLIGAYGVYSYVVYIHTPVMLPVPIPEPPGDVVYTPVMPPVIMREAHWGFLLPATAISVMAIAGGILALTRPKVAGALMLVAGISGFIAAYLNWLHVDYGWTYGLAVYPLITGGAIALAAHKKHPTGRTVAMALGILAGFMSTSGAYMAIDWILGYRDGIHWIGLTLSIWGFLCGVIAITGGVLVLTRPPVGGMLLLLGSIGSLGNTVMLFFTGGFLVTPIEIFMMYSFIAGLLLIPGAVLALASRKKQTTDG